MLVSRVLALAATVATSYAQYKGFNYGSTYTDGSAVPQSGYEAWFNAAKGLVGASGFTSARLYTMIQAGTTNTPTEAIQAAIDTQTSLLLGLWASAGEATINLELEALQSAIAAHGTAFTDLIAGISVGSEDLYRISPTGIINKSGVGAAPTDLVNYINQVRSALSSTAAQHAPIGHVDTWTAWVNGSNDAVIAACDFIGMDAYPYFQNTQANSIDNGYSLFFDAYDQTVAAVGSKPVWVTETGWPVSGPTEAQAVPSLGNAKTYWDKVACTLLGKTNTWWYTLQDAAPATPSPSFGLVGSTLSSTPLFDLTCPAGSSPSITATSAYNSAATSLLATSLASVSQPDNGKGPSTSGAAATTATVSPGGPVVSAQSSKACAKTTTVNVYVTTTYCPVTTTYVSDSQTYYQTTFSQTVFTITSAAAAPAPTTSTAPSSGSSSSSCPANLSGQYEYPHLIVPVDKTQPTKAGGTSYNGVISSTVSSIFNFDIPASDAGKTCSLVFLLPNKDQLQTSDYTLSGTGGIQVSQLKSPATESTSFSTVPAVESDLGSTSIAAGNSYVISTFSCPAGQRVGYEFSATGSLDLEYFQDYNPSALGAYITVC